MDGVKKGNLIVYFYLGLYSLFNIFAYLWIFITSLKDNSEFFSSSPWSLPEVFNWSNYIDAWRIGNIGQFFFNSAYVTTLSTVICLLVSSMAAYVIARIKLRGSGLILSFFMLGMMVPHFMIIIPLFSLLESLSLLNSLNGLILVYITVQIPLNVFILSSFYRSLPLDFEEAAAIDGASPLATFFRIIMPITLPAMTACAIINVLFYWNEFLLGLVFLGDKNSYTLPIGLFFLNQNAEYSAQWSTLFAGMVISGIPLLILFAFFQRQFFKGISQGGIKF